MVEPGDSQDCCPLKLSVSIAELQNLKHKHTPIYVSDTQEPLPTNGEKCMGMTSWGSKDFREGANEHFHLQATKHSFTPIKRGDVFPLRLSA